MARSRTGRRAPAAPARVRPRSPQYAGGGIVHGPQPRGYAQRTPKKMIAAALRGALSDRARDGRVHVVSGPGVRRRAVHQGRAGRAGRCHQHRQGAGRAAPRRGPGLAEPAQRRHGARAGRRPAERLRRAGQRRGRLHHRCAAALRRPVRSRQVRQGREPVEERDDAASDEASEDEASAEPSNAELAASDEAQDAESRPRSSGRDQSEEEAK